MRAVLALAAGLLAAIAAVDAAGMPADSARCRAQIVYRGVTYNGIEASHLRLKVGRAAGIAFEPQCDDTPPTPPKARYRRVGVRRLLGISPRVALARRDVPNVIYVAVDRCRGLRGRAAFVRCLRTAH